nr:NepR family anti-sigma factor [Rhizobium sp. Leaf371]
MDRNSQIVSKLRALYSAVEEEPLPDAFVDLLQQLDSVEKARKG